MENKELNAVNELIQKIKELGNEGTGALGYSDYKELLCLANEIKGEIIEK